MKKYYYYITVFLFTLFSLTATAQESKSGISAGKEPIEGLNIYPNPVSGGKLYITSKSGQSRDIEIFDVLGKRILAASISGKELNISDLTPGVYIIKVKEGEASETRKLIVK
ncbi:T9SS type A sorting domain-containing protein [Flavobacterium sp. RNTU_13]|uniref:T9SS type A sorting domain-containing protein n=1 Tax=Flavobacterium sp. RNTU_13 TaxID=3375145 RepID=UPI00398738AA